MSDDELWGQYLKVDNGRARCYFEDNIILSPDGATLGGEKERDLNQFLESPRGQLSCALEEVSSSRKALERFSWQPQTPPRESYADCHCWGLRCDSKQGYLCSSSGFQQGGQSPEGRWNGGPSGQIVEERQVILPLQDLQAFTFLSPPRFSPNSDARFCKCCAERDPSYSPELHPSYWDWERHMTGIGAAGGPFHGAGVGKMMADGMVGQRLLPPHSDIDDSELLPSSDAAPVLDCLYGRRLPGSRSRRKWEARKNTEERWSLGPCVTSFFDQLFCLSFLMLAIIAISALLLVLFRPRSPDFDMVDVQVNGLKVRTIRKPGGKGVPLPEIVVDVNLTVLLRVFNPNRVSVSYDPAKTDLLYRGQHLGEGELSAGWQPAMSSQIVQVPVELYGAGTEGLSRQMIEDFLSRRIPLEAKGVVEGSIALLFGKRFQVKMDCNIDVHPIKLTILDKSCTWEYNLWFSPAPQE